jgi:hypothetical protein
MCIEKLDLKIGRRESSMNAISFGTVARECPAMTSDEPKPADAAWNVLEAANDLGDHATVEACRRVIDANLKGNPAAPADLHLILEYFR